MGGWSMRWLIEGDLLLYKKERFSFYWRKIFLWAFANRSLLWQDCVFTPFKKTVSKPWPWPLSMARQGVEPNLSGRLMVLPNIYMYIYIYKNYPSLSLSLYIYIFYVYTCILIYIGICIYIYMCVCIYMWLYIYVYIYIYMRFQAVGPHPVSGL